MHRVGVSIVSKTILVIGAGWEQRRLLRSIKELGHTIIATHPSRDVSAVDLVDSFYVRDSRDIQSHYTLANTYKIDGIVTDNCDYSLYTSSAVASKLRLPSASIRSAIYSNDKVKQRTQCAMNQINQPKFFRVQTLQEMRDAASQLNFPLILKPVDSRGTMGVSVLLDVKQIEAAFFEAVAASPSHTLICEEYIDGELVTVDGFVFGNGHRALTVASREHSGGTRPVTRQISYPSKYDYQFRDRLLDNHECVVTALGYDYGHTHGEYIVTPDGQIFLVECANRGAGVFTSSTINPLITGLDLNKFLIDSSLGLNASNVQVSARPYMVRHAKLSFLDLEPGRVIKSENFSEIADLPYVKEFRSLYSVKQMVEPIDSCADRHLMVVVDGETSEDLEQNFRSFKDALKVEYY
jgi:biotin carboxylase